MLLVFETHRFAVPLESDSNWKQQNQAFIKASSCPALCRASTSYCEIAEKDVDGRDKPGHDDKKPIR
jgi:hypothetical protein